MPRVLIVDDDPVIQLLLRVNFEMDGFDVLTADDGEQGLALGLEQRPDVVLLDVMMPKLDGFEVLRGLRGDPRMKKTPVFLLSARSRDVDHKEGAEAGATAYIAKPFDPLVLLKHVKSTLDDGSASGSSDTPS